MASRRDEIEYMSVRYGSWGRFEFIVLMAAASLGTFVLATALRELATAWHPPQQAAFAWGQELPFFVLVAVLPAFTMAVELVLAVRRRGLGPESEELTRHERNRYGISARALARGLRIPAALASLLAILAVDSYSHVRADAIVVNRFWGFGERRYAFERVRAVRLHPWVRGADKVLREGIGYEAVLDDGERIVLGSAEAQPPRRQAGARRIAIFIARHAGLPITLELAHGDGEWMP